MTAAETSFTVPTDVPTFTMQRLFHASPDKVFAAMTKPEYVQQWYGPRRYEVHVPELDLRVGGAWRFLDTAADGTVYRFHGRYVDIVPNERIVATWVYEGWPDQTVVETHTLEERDGETLLTTTAVYPDFESRAGNIEAGGSEGAAESWDRMAEVLASMSGTSL